MRCLTLSTKKDLLSAGKESGRRKLPRKVLSGGMLDMECTIEISLVPDKNTSGKPNAASIPGAKHMLIRLSGGAEDRKCILSLKRWVFIEWCESPLDHGSLGVLNMLVLLLKAIVSGNGMRRWTS